MINYGIVGKWVRTEPHRMGTRELTLTLTSAYPTREEAENDNDEIRSSFDCIMNYIGFERKQ